MIVVKSIAGESYDLLTGEEQPKALVLSNGSSEVLVPITDESAMRVIQLMALTPTSEAPDLSGGTFSEDPPIPSRVVTNNPALHVAPDFQEDDVSDYDDPESGTASI